MLNVNRGSDARPDIPALLGPASRQGRSLAGPKNHRIHRARYKKIRRFFTRLFVHIFWWDIILNRPALIRFRKAPLPRWQRLAREYRALALQLGGVLIKLGQFLATRIDILPSEVTSELGRLQDEVPAVQYEGIAARIEDDFGRPIDSVFRKFAHDAVAAASLGQAHKATLVTGQEVVVKVLRPGIEQLVETDLVLITRMARRIRNFKVIRRHADLDKVAAEFTSVTLKELDMELEGRNAEGFAADFKGDSSVYVPRIYWEYTTRHVLTMEDVGYIKIDDQQGLRSAGISPTDVVGKLFDIYLHQFTESHFVHADPHAGNLFVRPLPFPDETASLIGGSFLPGQPVPFRAGRQFQMVFVDFGMAIAIPKKHHRFIRNYIIGIGTRDAHMIVESYVDAGIMLPGADLRRVESMTQAILDRFSGSLLGQMKDVDFQEYASILNQFRDLIYSSPFQFQPELLFVFRAMGILAGIVTDLAPDFDPMVKLIPFARRLFLQDLPMGTDGLLSIGFNVVKFVSRLNSVLTKLDGGKLVIESLPSPESKQMIGDLRVSLNRLTAAVLAGGLFLSGVVWHTGYSTQATFIGAGIDLGKVLMILSAIPLAYMLLPKRRQ